MENRITCTDDILNLPDMQSARKLLIQWKIPTKGINKREEAIKLLLEYWKENEGRPVKFGPTPTAGLSEAISLDEKNRQKLCEKYDLCLEFYRKLPKQHQQDLDGVFPHLAKSTDEKKKELKVRECTILVAGETGAGKSSFINLLLGTSILPTSNLPCTATICELRTSPDGRKSAVLKYKNIEDRKRRQPPRVLDLHNAAELRELADCIERVDEDMGESPFERIEIYWPFPILQEGIVIVDTPGIGGGKQMSKVVEQYLSKSFGFIYLVNSSAAGGIQKGRLKDFLRTVVNYAEDDFSPSATMFVCNKWETVPDSDKAEVKSNTFDKLVRIYPGLREDQIYYMSVQQALSAVEYNTMTKDHAAVSEGITKLFPSSLRNKLNVHYRWLSQVLKRSMYSLKVAKVMDAKSMEKNQEMIADLERRMERLEVNSRHSVEDLHKGVAYEVESLYKTITTMLRDRDFVQKLVTWEAKDCPRPDDWKKTAREASERIASRIALEVNLWERNNEVNTNIKEKIVKKFNRDFELMEDQIKAIEGALLAGETRVITDLHKSMKKQLPVKQLFKKAKHNEDSDSVKGLGGTVSSAGGIDVSDRQIRRLFSGYKKDTAQQKMIEATEIYISDILSGQSLRERLQKYLGRFIKGIDNVAKMIPEFLKADKQLIKTLQLQMRSAEDNLKEVYPELIVYCQNLQGQLDLFFVYRILEMDFRLRDLTWNEKEDLIGTGSFAEVFKAKLQKGSDMIPVALKVCKDALKETTVTDILLEDRTLRELDHENIVRYYGSTCKQDGKGGSVKVKWIMITEFCDGTLKDLIIKDGSFSMHSFENPANFKITEMQIKSMREMAGYVIQICKGLQYLHSKDLVHRDLKCENVLTLKGVLKLTDFGLTKKESNIAASLVGSPVYMAPEVLLQTGLYGRKADIYSLAIVLWEMWYGIDAADHIGKQLCGTLDSFIKKGFRPSFSKTEKPPDDWKALIQKCWEYEPDNRPDVFSVLNFFQDFLKSSNNSQMKV